MRWSGRSCRSARRVGRCGRSPTVTVFRLTRSAERWPRPTGRPPNRPRSQGRRPSRRANRGPMVGGCWCCWLCLRVVRRNVRRHSRRRAGPRIFPGSPPAPQGCGCGPGPFPPASSSRTRTFAWSFPVGLGPRRLVPKMPASICWPHRHSKTFSATGHDRCDLTSTRVDSVAIVLAPGRLSPGNTYSPP